MKRDIRLVAVDLDGTLLNEENHVSRANTAAAEKAAAAGVIVMPATGRQLGAVPAEVLALPGLRYVLTSNGAKIYDLKTNSVLYENYLYANIVQNVLNMLEDFDCLVGIYIDGKGYTTKLDLDDLAGRYSANILNYMGKTRIQLDDIAAFIKRQGDVIEKITVHFCSAAERARAMAAAEKVPGVVVTSSVADNMELNAETANKGAGILALAQHLGISRQQVMAIGDNFNDMAMLQAVGYPVAMGNAEEDIKRIAAHVTLPNTEDGVAAAIERIL